MSKNNLPHDLVVLDMIMDPGMDGLDTYIKILEIHPNQKAIIVSGFAETERVARARSQPPQCLLRFSTLSMTGNSCFIDGLFDSYCLISDQNNLKLHNIMKIQDVL